jgi:hypothetical protein
LCKAIPYAPVNSAEYLNNYLNTNGYGDLQASDIAYCWKQPPSGAITMQIATTTLTAGVPAGSQSLPVAELLGFQVGQSIDIDHGTALAEVKIITSFTSSPSLSSSSTSLLSLSTTSNAGYISLSTPLVNSHLAGVGVVSKQLGIGSWTKNIACAPSFTYDGKSYTGCTTVDRNHGWCSIDAVFVGKWEYCTFVSGVTPAKTTITYAMLDADASSLGRSWNTSSFGSSSLNADWMNWKLGLLIAVLLCCMCVCCITSCVLCAMADRHDEAGQLGLNQVPAGRSYTPMYGGMYGGSYAPVNTLSAYPTAVYPGRY